MPLFRFSGSPFPPPGRRVFTAIVPLPEAAENLPQKGQGTFGSSAKNLFDVLTYIKDHDSTLNLIAILPKSGLSGTLKYRPSVKGSQLKGAVIAKTGSLQNVSNLAGFIKSKNNKLIPFVILENSLTYPQDLREEINQLKKKSPHYEFEKSVITDIYNEKILSFK